MQPRLARDADRDFRQILLRRLQRFQQCEFKELEEQFQRAERDIKQPKPTLAEVAAEEDTQDAAAVDPLFNKVGKVVRSGNLSKAARLLGDDKGVADVDVDVLAILRGKHPDVQPSGPRRCRLCSSPSASRLCNTSLQVCPVVRRMTHLDIRTS